MNITANQTGDNSYTTAAQRTAVITVTKGNQTISFSALPNKTFGSAAFDLTATASSGLSVSYSSSNTSVATVTGQTVTIVGAGTTTITASQVGNNNYNAATSVQQTLTVTKADQTISFSALSNKPLGSAAFDLAATASSGLSVSYSSSNTSVAIVSGQTVTIMGAGTTTITGSQAGNVNYNAAPDVSQSLTITTTKQAQTITFSALPTKTQGDQPFQLSASSSSGLAINYSITSGPATVSASTLTLTGAGTVTVKAGQAGNANYNAATDVSQSFCVNPSQPTITASFADATAPVLSSSSAQGNQWYLNGTAISSATSSSLPVTQAGSYTVKVTVDGCSSAASSAQTVVVTDIEKSVEHSLTIYPNPVIESINIQYQEVDKVESVSVMDLMGKSIMEGGKELLNQEINVGHYSNGMYLVRVKASNGVHAGKFLKK